MYFRVALDKISFIRYFSIQFSEGTVDLKLPGDAFIPASPRRRLTQPTIIVGVAAIVGDLVFTNKFVKELLTVPVTIF